jgi:hypothetical protein
MRPKAFSPALSLQALPEPGLGFCKHHGCIRAMTKMDKPSITLTVSFKKVSQFPAGSCESRKVRCSLKVAP